MSPAFLEAVLAGDRASAELIAGLTLPSDWPDEHDSRFLRLRLDQMRGDPSSQQWLVRAMVLRAQERPMVGHIGFHGSPETVGRAEMGYTVMPNHRRQGYATEAARALMDWAAREHGVQRFFVSIAPNNSSSLAMAAKLGFRQVGEQIDEEDGLEYVFAIVRR
jgi:RimJ/RimL family protein N-acetyltransferase